MARKMAAMLIRLVFSLITVVAIEVERAQLN